MGTTEIIGSLSERLAESADTNVLDVKIATIICLTIGGIVLIIAATWLIWKIYIDRSTSRKNKEIREYELRERERAVLAKREEKTSEQKGIRHKVILDYYNQMLSRKDIEPDKMHEILNKTLTLLNDNNDEKKV